MGSGLSKTTDIRITAREETGDSRSRLSAFALNLALVYSDRPPSLMATTWPEFFSAECGNDGCRNGSRIDARHDSPAVAGAGAGGKGISRKLCAAVALRFARVTAERYSLNLTAHCAAAAKAGSRVRNAPANL